MTCVILKKGKKSEKEKRTNRKSDREGKVEKRERVRERERGKNRKSEREGMEKREKE